MGKYGIRISQAGVPISRAADYQMVMDDRWPLIEMKFMDIVDLRGLTASAAVEQVVVYQHNLGFLPAFKPLIISYTKLPTDPVFHADEKNIYVDVVNPSSGAFTFDFKFFISILNRDCSKEFAAPIDIVTSQQSTGPSRYGLKIKNDPSAQGMAETDKSKYSLNTNAKTLAVQAHGIRTVNPTLNAIVIDHFLGYPPTYLLAPIIESSVYGKKQIGPLGNGGGLSKSTTITLTIQGAQSIIKGDYMFLILKDPVDVAR